MLRFGNKPPPPAPSIFGGSSRGVWKLLLLLGLVIVMMRQLARPEAGVMLGRVLGLARQPDAEAVPPSADGDRVQAPGSANDRRDHPAAPPLDRAWDAVKDNALFTKQEQPAWFLLLDLARQTPQDHIARQAAPVTYAQLASQPDAYRAQPVRVRGRVLRESLKTAPENSAGIESYHQLWLAPVGGGDWPIVVYSLALPEGFPSGDGIGADVSVDGLFFKNWTFAHEDGMGIAPVIVAPNVQWTAPIAAKPQAANPVDSRWLLFGAAGAALAAAVFVAWALRQTRRPRVTRDMPAVDLSHLEAGP